MSHKDTGRDLVRLSFNDITAFVLEEGQRAKRAKTTNEDMQGVLVLLEMYIVLCGKWLISPKVDKNDKIAIEQAKRLARSMHSDICNMQERKLDHAWADSPIPKTTNEELALKWKAMGLVTNLDTIYVALTRKEKRRLEKAQLRWKQQNQEFTPSYAWADAPLFGIPNSNNIERE